MEKERWVSRVIRGHGLRVRWVLRVMFAALKGLWSTIPFHQFLLQRFRFTAIKLALARRQLMACEMPSFGFQPLDLRFRLEDLEPGCRV